MTLPHFRALLLIIHESKMVNNCGTNLILPQSGTNSQQGYLPFLQDVSGSVTLMNCVNEHREDERN